MIDFSKIIGKGTITKSIFSGQAAIQGIARALMPESTTAGFGTQNLEIDTPDEIENEYKNTATKASSLDASQPNVSEPKFERAELPAVKLDGENIVRSLEVLHNNIVNYLSAINKNNIATFDYVKSKLAAQDATFVSLRQKTDQLNRDYKAVDDRIRRVEDKFSDLRTQFDSKKKDLIDDNQDATPVEKPTATNKSSLGDLLGDIELGALVSGGAVLSGTVLAAIGGLVAMGAVWDLSRGDNSVIKKYLWPLMVTEIETQVWPLVKKAFQALVNNDKDIKWLYDSGPGGSGLTRAAENRAGLWPGGKEKELTNPTQRPEWEREDEPPPMFTGRQTQAVVSSAGRAASGLYNQSSDSATDTIKQSQTLRDINSAVVGKERAFTDYLSNLTGLNLSSPTAGGIIGRKTTEPAPQTPATGGQPTPQSSTTPSHKIVEGGMIPPGLGNMLSKAWQKAEHSPVFNRMIGHTTGLVGALATSGSGPASFNDRFGNWDKPQDTKDASAVPNLVSSFGPPDLAKGQTISPSDLIQQMSMITGGRAQGGSSGGLQDLRGGNLQGDSPTNQYRGGGGGSGGGGASGRWTPGSDTPPGVNNYDNNGKTIPADVLAKAASLADRGPAAMFAFMRSQNIPVDSAWCGDFVAAVVKAGGGTPVKGYSIANSWLNYGTAVKPGEEQPGDIAVLSRGYAPGQMGGHVGIVGPGGYDPKTGKFNFVAGNSPENDMISQRGMQFRRPLQPQSYPTPGGQNIPGNISGSLSKEQYEKMFAETLLSGQYDHVVAQAKANGISPVLLASIMAQESGRGRYTSGNNPGGIMDPATGSSRKKQYGSIEEGISETARIVAKNYTKGGGTLKGLHDIYSPEGAANDPGGLNKDWLPGVQKFMGQLAAPEPQQQTPTADTKPTHKGYEFTPGGPILSKMARPDGTLDVGMGITGTAAAATIKNNPLGRAFYNALPPELKRDFDNGRLDLKKLTPEMYEKLQKVYPSIADSIRPIAAIGNVIGPMISGIGSMAGGIADFYGNMMLEKHGGKGDRLDAGTVKSPFDQIQNRWDDPAFGSVPDSRFSPMGGMITGPATTLPVGYDHPYIKQSQKYWGATAQIPTSAAPTHPAVPYVNAQGQPSASAGGTIVNKLHPGFGDYSHPDPSVFPAPPNTKFQPMGGGTIGKAVAPPIKHIEESDKFMKVDGQALPPHAKTQITIPRANPEQQEDQPGSQGYGQRRDPDGVGICSV